MAGRKSKYNEEVASEILRRFASGEKLTAICKPDRMPSRITVFNWKSAHPGFAKAYEEATESHTEALLDKLHELVMSCDDKSAKSAKVKADYITWFVSKLNRAKYGDKIDIQHNVNIDISKTLQEAMSRMQSLGHDQNIINVSCQELPIPETETASAT